MTDREIFIDPMTDYGFKRIFGLEVNKDLLIAFLNGLFRGRKHIVDLIYNQNEHVGENTEIGSVVFDLTCTAKNGEQFIIEVQRTVQANLKKRMFYYGSKLVTDQAPRGDRRGWNYGISEVYVIVLMDGFRMPEGKRDGRFLHDICLMDRNTQEIFYEHFGFIYIELINFEKSEDELESDLDRWLFVLRNMSRLERLPLFFRKPIFEKLFHIAAYSKLNKEERQMYDRSLRDKWDAQSIRESNEYYLKKAVEDGLKEGMEKGMEQGMEQGMKQGMKQGMEQGMEKARLEAESKRLEEVRAAVLRMLAKGLDKDLVADVLGLAISEVEKLSVDS